MLEISKRAMGNYLNNIDAKPNLVKYSEPCPGIKLGTSLSSYQAPWLTIYLVKE